jgi:hypothetical protein
LVDFCPGFRLCYKLFQSLWRQNQFFKTKFNALVLLCVQVRYGLALSTIFKYHFICNCIILLLYIRGWFKLHLLKCVLMVDFIRLYYFHACSWCIFMVHVPKLLELVEFKLKEVISREPTLLVMVVGVPNVGKSALINSIHQIASQFPGKMLLYFASLWWDVIVLTHHWWNYGSLLNHWSLWFWSYAIEIFNWNER